MASLIDPRPPTCSPPASALSQRMSRAVRTQGRAVRLPGHHYRDMARARRAMADLAQRLGRQPGCEELAQECGFSVT
jgi:DNA-directed RNA polymerase sigma subunit (sigma70/sigma32)